MATAQKATSKQSLQYRLINRIGDTPTVKVKYQGKIYKGEIKGYRLDFPFVALIDYPTSKNELAPSFEYAWATIERAINENRVLIA